MLRQKNYRVVRPTGRQSLQMRSFDVHDLAPGGIGLADPFIDEATIGIEIGNVGSAAKEERLLQHVLQMGVRSLDRAVLLGDLGVVPAVLSVLGP